MNSFQKQVQQLQPQVQKYIQAKDLESALALTSNTQIRKLIRNAFYSKGVLRIEPFENISDISLDIYSMDISSIQIIINHILETKPCTIIEFGTGMSTIYIAKTIAYIQNKDANYKPIYIYIC